MKGKQLALLACAAALLVLLRFGSLFTDRLLEPWYLHKLETGDLGEQKTAARRLGEMRSFRAIPALLDVMRKAQPNHGIFALFQGGELSCFQDALVKIGRAASPALIDAIGREDRFFASLAIATLKRIYETNTPTFEIIVPGQGVWLQREPILEAVRDNETETKEVRAAAARALRTVRLDIPQTTLTTP